MSIFEYDQELEEKKYREAEYEHGRQDGYDAGIQEGRAAGIREGRTEGLSEGKRTAAINLKAMNMTVEQIAQAIEEDVEVVEQWLA